MTNPSLDQRGELDCGPQITWWGRFDPAYSRNRLLRHLLARRGYAIRDFRPYASLTGAFEARFADLGTSRVVWVPAFRHRDLVSARKYADRCRVPLIFDPLISAWDKAVFERGKYDPVSRRAARLKRWERSLFTMADAVIADTESHARFFREELASPPERTFVVPVGAEEQVFTEQPRHPPGSPPEVLFYGSFIGLQDPETIVAAARLVPEARWTLLGDGPLRRRCVALSEGCTHICFEPWIAYRDLPRRVGAADLVLGIFGSSAKASRVIPNKVYQALACGRPVITRHSDAYPAGGAGGGLQFVPPADPDALAEAVRRLLAHPGRWPRQGKQAREFFDRWFSAERIDAALAAPLAAVGLSDSGATLRPGGPSF